MNLAADSEKELNALHVSHMFSQRNLEHKLVCE